jgi:gamma-glutamylcyclotransferase (GGCT)/AIG2-like uncharacterized protein YtfP
MKEILYFAYGSNLDVERLRDRIGDFSVYGTHKLQGYALTFSSSGYANIVPNKKEYVEGVLFHVTPEQLKTLNRIEALYSPHFFTIDNYVVCTYIDEDILSYFGSLEPTTEYVKCIKRGAVNFKLNKTLKICNGILKKSSMIFSLIR